MEIDHQLVRLLDDADREGILALSRDLETDEMPCSFWALTPTRLEEWLSDSSRHLLVAEADTTLTGIGSYPTCHIRVRHLPFRVYCSLQGGEESSR